MILVSCYSRIILFSVFADFRYKTADLVVFFNSLEQCRIGCINTVNLGHFVEDFVSRLCNIVLDSVVSNFERHIKKAQEKLVIFNKLEKFKMLCRSVHFGAGLGCKKRIEEVITALNRS